MPAVTDKKDAERRKEEKDAFFRQESQCHL